MSLEYVKDLLSQILNLHLLVFPIEKFQVQIFFKREGNMVVYFLALFVLIVLDYRAWMEDALLQLLFFFWFLVDSNVFFFFFE